MSNPFKPSKSKHQASLQRKLKRNTYDLKPASTKIAKSSSQIPNVRRTNKSKKFPNISYFFSSYLANQAERITKKTRRSTKVNK